MNFFRELKLVHKPILYPGKWLFGLPPSPLMIENDHFWFTKIYDYQDPFTWNDKDISDPLIYKRQESRKKIQDFKRNNIKNKKTAVSEYNFSFLDRNVKLKKIGDYPKLTILEGRVSDEGFFSHSSARAPFLCTPNYSPDYRDIFWLSDRLFSCICH